LTGTTWFVILLYSKLKLELSSCQINIEYLYLTFDIFLEDSSSCHACRISFELVIYQHLPPKKAYFSFWIGPKSLLKTRCCLEANNVKWGTSKAFFWGKDFKTISQILCLFFKSHKILDVLHRAKYWAFVAPLILAIFKKLIQD